MTHRRRDPDRTLARARSWRFPAPDGGGEVVVSYPFLFRAEDSGATTNTPQTSSGTLAASAVREVVRRHVREVSRCHQSVDASLEGRFTLRFVIAPDGSVGSAAVANASDTVRGVADCVAQAARGWRFPAPEGGSVTVSYPFVLRTR